MFFIILAVVIAAIILAVLLIKIKIEIIVVQKDITLNIIIFGFIKFTKKYLIKREKETFLTLYFVNKKGMKKIITLKDAVKRIMKNEPVDITLVNILKIFAKYKTEPRNNGYRYIYKKMKYILKAYLNIGVGDAYSTSMVCGLIGIISSALCAILNNKAHKTGLSISPEFSKQVFSVRINCIIVISPADIIIGYFISKKKEAVRKNASN